MYRQTVINHKSVLKAKRRESSRLKEFESQKFTSIVGDSTGVGDDACWDEHYFVRVTENFCLVREYRQ